MKISIIGAGNVGASIAQRILEKNIAQEISIIDIIEGLPEGKTLDMMESASIELFSGKIKGSNSYVLANNSDIVVITSGIPRKPGMTRDELQTTNANIVKSVTENIIKVAPNSIIIVVTNPLDVMAYVAYKVSKFQSNKIIGMAGVLDSARFRYFISEELDVSIEDINAFVLGGHGDDMVPLPRYTTVAGIPLPQLLSKEKIDRLIDRTKNGGIEIVNYMKTGSAFYAPSSSVVAMIESIIYDKKRILPCSSWLTGQYGIKELFAGVPVKLGKNGVEQIIEIDLTEEEKKELDISVDHVRENINRLNLNFIYWYLFK